MRFALRHRFDAPRARVELATIDPAYEQRLETLPNLGERRLVEEERRADGTIRRVVFYRLRADLSPAVTRAIGTKDVTWDEISEFDPARHEWRFTIRPKVFASKFDADGVYRFREEGSATVRDVEVEVRVRVPVVGRLVEKAIGQGLVENLDAEARMLAEHLRT
jgi:hypothetical protein